MFNAACIQLNSNNDMQSNISKALGFVEDAAKNGADFITLPENVAFMAANSDELLLNIHFPEQHPALEAFKNSAAKLKKWLLIGSLAIKVPHSDKIANRSFLIDDKGNIAAYYDKIHLYTASVEGGETHNEPKRYLAGEKTTIAKTPFGTIGMTICYDLRFPHLFRKIAQNSTNIITVPSSFTKFTGQAHWHVLLRARAIENGCYIIAPAQTGSHPANRQTYGHSLIIDPWGKILSDGGKKEGVTIAKIDIDMVKKVRQQLPSLEHDREFDF